MTAHVPGKRLGDTTFLSKSFERIHTTFVVGYWKHPAVYTQSTVFFHNLLGIIKQLDVGFRSSLLSKDNDPFTFIEKFLDVLFLQVLQINESETCKTTEQEQVTHHAHLLSCDRCLHQQVNLFFCQNLPCCFLVLVLVSSERVFDEPLVINRPKNHGTEIADKHHCGIYLQLFVYSKECLIVRNKRQR